MDTEKTKGTYKRFSTTLKATGDRWAIWRVWNCVSRSLVISGCTLKDYTFSGWTSTAEFKLTIDGYEDQLALVKAVLEGWRDDSTQTYSKAEEVPAEPLPPKGAAVEFTSALKLINGKFAIYRLYVLLACVLKTSQCVLKDCTYSGGEQEAQLNLTIVGSQTQIELAQAVIAGWTTLV